MTTFVILLLVSFAIGASAQFELQEGAEIENIPLTEPSSSLPVLSSAENISFQESTTPLEEFSSVESTSPLENNPLPESTTPLEDFNSADSPTPLENIPSAEPLTTLNNLNSEKSTTPLENIPPAESSLSFNNAAELPSPLETIPPPEPSASLDFSSAESSSLKENIPSPESSLFSNNASESPEASAALDFNSAESLSQLEYTSSTESSLSLNNAGESPSSLLGNMPSPEPTSPFEDLLSTLLLKNRHLLEPSAEFPSSLENIPSADPSSLNDFSSAELASLESFPPLQENSRPQSRRQLGNNRSRGPPSRNEPSPVSDFQNIPPGQARRKSKNIPPGQARRQSKNNIPPGQARRQSQNIPPGQARRQLENSPSPAQQLSPLDNIATQLETTPAAVFRYNKGWQRQQKQHQKKFKKPKYNSGRSVEYAKPRKPHPQRLKNFHNIYKGIDKKPKKGTDEEDIDDGDGEAMEMLGTDEDFDGRSVVSPGEYPHMAAIGFQTTDNLIDFKCGGSLINAEYVVTAAHCCYVNGDSPVLVKFGIINLKDENEDIEMPQNRTISEVIIHPLYNKTLNYNDIALLRLMEPIFFTRFVRPIRLWARDTIPYAHVFTMGYGSTSFAKAPTNILTELDLTAVPLPQCNEALLHDESSPHGITETQICAKDYLKNRDTCQGDSGGPLQLNLRRRRGRRGFRFYLVGIISYGEVCGNGSPGVYTRVSSYVDWIASIVWPEEFQNF